jgi:mannose-1-phosphate guanylyltransferase/mannose-6-phosphate isomerase
VAVTLRAVLLAGGAGTRLWPLSTESRPKQFLRIRGTTSLLQDAYRRVQPIASRVLVATAARYADGTRRDLPGLSPADLLLEPSRRNTGAAVVGAALFLADSGDEPVAVLPADQTVADEDEFRRCLEAAAGAASAGSSIAILGVAPVRPDTEYGYVEVDPGAGARRVRRFIEKPDRATAEEYLRAGRFFWNAGIFVFRPSALIEAAAAAAPELLEACRRYHERSSPEAFERIPAISFDYAVMEKAENVMCIPCKAGWSDVGSYRTLRDIRGADAAGNLIVSDRRVVAPGLRDTIVAVSEEGVLVLPFSRDGEIRALVASPEEPRR